MKNLIAGPSLEADGMITIYEIGSDEVVAHLEGLEIWQMLQSHPSYPYFPGDGRCIVCGADTLWGDAPHREECKIIRQCNNCNKTFVSLEDVGGFLDICAECHGIIQEMDKGLAEQEDRNERQFLTNDIPF